MIDVTKFHKIADEFLQDLADDIEKRSADIEVDYFQGVLTITLPDDKQYVINKHEPTRQIWFSSPISGAHKFGFDETNNFWAKPEGLKLLDLLNSEIF